jgi:hypothetical protein
MIPALRLSSRSHRPLPETECIEGWRMRMVGPSGVGFTLGKAACLNPWAFPKIGVYYMRSRRSAGGPA